MNIVGIDPGYRNFAWVVWQDGVFTGWHHADLYPRGGKITRHQVRRLTRDWVAAHHQMLKAADKIVVESQIKTKFIVQETVIYSVFPKKTVFVHPLSVSRKFHLPMTRDEKKLATIAYCKKLGHVCPNGDCNHQYDAAALVLAVL